MSKEHKEALRASRKSADEKTSILLGKKYRIYAVDDRNWTLQKNNSATDVDPIWVSMFYYSDLESLLTIVAKRMLDKKLKACADISTLNNLAEEIKRAEESVLAELKSYVKKVEKSA